MLPKSGEGPSTDARKTGRYELVLGGELPDGVIRKARFKGQGDPGVRSTTLMFTEAARCLAEDADRISVGGGFWTPSSVMGRLLHDPITAHAGLTFELADGDSV